jgi:sec-independent protein translocase protein TatC
LTAAAWNDDFHEPFPRQARDALDWLTNRENGGRITPAQNICLPKPASSKTMKGACLPSTFLAQRYPAMTNHANNIWDSDHDDVFAASRMTFGEHIEDLRAHLWRAIKGLGVALVVGFLIGSYVLEFMTVQVTEQLTVFQQRRIENTWEKLKSDPDLQKLNEPRVVNHEVNIRALAFHLGLPAPKEEWASLPTRIRPLEEAIQLDQDFLALKPPRLVVMSPTEGIVVFMKVCLATAFVLASPWIFFQLWSFVAAGLYPAEKRLIHLFLPFSVILFLAGVALCQFIVIPAAVGYLLEINEWLGFQPDLRLTEWLGFAVFLPLVFGISFQTPLVMLVLQRIGIVPLESFRRKRKLAWFLLAVFAAVITPTPDPINMMFLAVPMGFLYELGIALCRFLPGGPPGSGSMGIGIGGGLACAASAWEGSGAQCGRA